MSKNDRYIVRKYIMARSAQEAINKDKKTPVMEVYIDDDYKKEMKTELNSCIGFQAEKEEECSDSLEN